MAEGKENFLKQFRDGTSNELKELTATQFMEVWDHYDADGNGYIEGTELDNFLRELVTSVGNIACGPEVMSETAFTHLKEMFMDAFDDNADDRIEIGEMAAILPTDETFLLLFRRDNPLESSVEFMRVWREFDKDCSGYIEADELKDFLQQLLKDARKDAEVSEELLMEYTTTMLALFDQNKDGKLQLSEMAKLLPVRENFLCRPIFRGGRRITARDIDRVFQLYDRDKNGKIENEELHGFLKDLMELVQKDYDSDDIVWMKSAILDQWDLDKDGKIDKNELTMLLLQQGKMVAQEEGWSSEADTDDDGNDKDDE